MKPKKPWPEHAKSRELRNVISRTIRWRVLWHAPNVYHEANGDALRRWPMTIAIHVAGRVSWQKHRGQLDKLDSRSHQDARNAEYLSYMPTIWSRSGT